MNSCSMDSRLLAIQYTHRAAGMVKPIHREMRGETIIMLFMLALLAACWACLLTALVFMEMREKITLEPAEMTGRRNRPKPPSIVQNWSLGIWDRSMRPRKSKLMEKMFCPAAPAAVAADCTADRLSGVIREDRYSWL